MKNFLLAVMVFLFWGGCLANAAEKKVSPGRLVLPKNTSVTKHTSTGGVPGLRVYNLTGIDLKFYATTYDATKRKMKKGKMWKIAAEGEALLPYSKNSICLTFKGKGYKKTFQKILSTTGKDEIKVMP